MKSKSSGALFALFAVSILCVGATAVLFGYNEIEHPTIYSTVIDAEQGYNSPVFNLTYEDFKNAGYDYGDTFDVSIDGVVLKDAVLTHDYMGLFMFDTYINANGTGMVTKGFATAGSMWNTLLPLSYGSTVVISYTGTNSDYLKLDHFLVKEKDQKSPGQSDEEFANFNSISVGKIKDGKLFSSYSPFGGKNRNAAVAEYVKNHSDTLNIRYDVALSFTDSTIKTAKTNDYFKDIVNDGRYIAPNLGYRYFAQTDKVKSVLEFIADTDDDGGILIHCNAGRDRSGFMVTLISALCGATEKEMTVLAAQPYVNLYGVEVGSEEYNIIMKNTYYRNMYFIQNYGMIDTLLTGGKLPIDWSDKDVSGIDTQKAAQDFCVNYLGMSEKDVTKLKNRLCS